MPCSRMTVGLPVPLHQIARRRPPMSTRCCFPSDGALAAATGPDTTATDGIVPGTTACEVAADGTTRDGVAVEGTDVDPADGDGDGDSKAVNVADASTTGSWPPTPRSALPAAR